jgi:hypothetical protein
MGWNERLARIRALRTLGRVLINAQMSGFEDEAEILCSTRALPVVTRSGLVGQLVPRASPALGGTEEEREADHAER